MKKSIPSAMSFFFSLALLTLSVVTFAADAPSPVQKLMRQRMAWFQRMSASHEDGKIFPIAQDAKALATETKKTAAGLSDPKAKELTLAVASLATELSKAAADNSAFAVMIKLGEIKGRCAECHRQFRK